jgi:hypothetical protein
MHIDHLSITPTTAHNSSNHDQSITVDKIPYTSLILCAVTRLGDEVEFQCVGEGKKEEDNGQIEERSHFGLLC